MAEVDRRSGRRATGASGRVACTRSGRRVYTTKRSSSSTRPNRARAGGQNQGISGHRSARPGGQNGCISAHSGSPSAPVSQVRARAPAHTRARGQRQNNARSSPSDAHGRAAVLRGVVGRVVGYQRERRRYRDGVRAPTEKTTPGPRPGGLPAGRQIPADSGSRVLLPAGTMARKNGAERARGEQRLRSRPLVRYTTFRAFGSSHHLCTFAHLLPPGLGLQLCSLPGSISPEAMPGRAGPEGLRKFHFHFHGDPISEQPGKAPGSLSPVPGFTIPCSKAIIQRRFFGLAFFRAPSAARSRSSRRRGSRSPGVMRRPVMVHHPASAKVRAVSFHSSPCPSSAIARSVSSNPGRSAHGTPCPAPAAFRQRSAVAMTRRWRSTRCRGFNQPSSGSSSGQGTSCLQSGICVG